MTYARAVVLIALLALAGCDRGNAEERRLRDLAKNSSDLVIRVIACSKLPLRLRPANCTTHAQQYLAGTLAEKITGDRERDQRDACLWAVAGVLSAPASPEAARIRQACCPMPEGLVLGHPMCILPPLQDNKEQP